MELNNFKLKPTALRLGFTAAEININPVERTRLPESSGKKQSGLDYRGGGGKRQHGWCERIGRTHGCTSKAHLRAYNVPGKELGRGADPTSTGAEAQSCLPACLPAGSGPLAFRARASTRVGSQTPRWRGNGKWLRSRPFLGLRRAGSREAGGSRCGRSFAKLGLHADEVSGKKGHGGLATSLIIKSRLCVHTNRSYMYMHREYMCPYELCIDTHTSHITRQNKCYTVYYHHSKS